MTASWETRRRNLYTLEKESYTRIYAELCPRHWARATHTPLPDHNTHRVTQSRHILLRQIGQMQALQNDFYRLAKVFTRSFFVISRLSWMTDVRVSVLLIHALDAFISQLLTVLPLSRLPINAPRHSNGMRVGATKSTSLFIGNRACRTVGSRDWYHSACV